MLPRFFQGQLVRSCVFVQNRSRSHRACGHFQMENFLHSAFLPTVFRRCGPSGWRLWDWDTIHRHRIHFFAKAKRGPSSQSPNRDCSEYRENWSVSGWACSNTCAEELGVRFGSFVVGFVCHARKSQRMLRIPILFSCLSVCLSFIKFRSVVGRSDRGAPIPLELPPPGLAARST